MITQKGRFLIRHEEVDNEYLENFDFEKLEEKYQEIKKFYSFDKDLPLIRICFIYSPKEFLFFTGKEFKQNWMCAMVGYHTTINIFSPSVIEKFTIHKKESIFGTFAHEVSHLFYGYSKLVDLPLFNEGLAKYHSAKNCDNKINFNIPSLKGGKDPQYNYGIGHLMICSIMEHFGESGANKIIKFLKSASLQMDEEELFKLFKEIFGKSADSLIELKGGKEK